MNTLTKSMVSLSIFTCSVGMAPFAYAQAPVQETYLTDVLQSADEQQQFVQAQASPQANLSVLLEKLSQMQQEIQQLRGKVEVQAHDLKLLNDQQRAFYQDLDKRLVLLQPEPAGNTHAGLNDASKSGVTELAATQQASTTVEATAYAKAYQLIQDKHYQAGLIAMKAFLNNYPNSLYAANAHYWIGELYAENKQWQLAVDEFNTVVNQYPNSNKVSAAMLKIGFAYYEEGKWQEARQQLTKIKQRFPDTTTARLAGTRLQSMQKNGL